MDHSTDRDKMLRFGAIGVFGRANSGKSTLVNTLVGEKVSIVSARPQTTRKRILGVLTVGKSQIVFCDTPGLHAVKNRLDAFMDHEIVETVAGLVGALYLVDCVKPQIEEDKGNLERLFSGSKIPVCLLINKCDLLDPGKVTNILETYKNLWKFEATFAISSLSKQNLKKLQSHLLGRLPEGVHAYDSDFFTASPEREIAAEIIRETMLEQYFHEIPHSTAVLVEEFKERENGKTYISANLILERDSQKKIVVGKAGEGIKKLGSVSREKLNQILGRDIFLQLWVKVRANWRKNEEWVRRFGYTK